MNKISLLFGLVLWASPALAQLAQVDTASAEYTASPWTVTNVTVSGENKVLYCFFSIDVTADVNVTATWDPDGNNQAMTEIHEGTDADGRYGAVFELIAPGNATNDTVEGTSSNGTDGGIHCVSYSGADQTDPSGTVDDVFGNVTSLTSASLSPGVGDWIVGYATVNNDVSGSLSADGTGQTARIGPTAHCSGCLTIMSFDDRDGNETETMDVSWTGSTRAGLFSFVLSAASAALPPRLLLTGVGR